MALIGSPVAHSGSPAMYNYSFARLGLDYVYVAFDVKKEETGEAIKAMRLFGMRGMNVTMPCKGEALTYMDKLSPAARLMGAVNTIVNDNGVLTGYNTDGAGFVRNLKEHGISVQGKCITLAGGGGAATAIQVQCALDGAKEIRVFNRRAHTREMAERVAAEAPGCRITVSDIADGDALRESIASSGIFINATSVGMKPMDGESVIKDTSVSGRIWRWRMWCITRHGPGCCGRHPRRAVPAWTAVACFCGRAWRRSSFIRALTCRWTR